MVVERRKRKRVPFISGTEFIIENKKIMPQLQDISMSGMSLQTAEIENIGTTGEIVIHLICGEEKKEIHALCRVVRHILPAAEHSVKGMGLEIVRIDPDSSILLYNLIRYQDTA